MKLNFLRLAVLFSGVSVGFAALADGALHMRGALSVREVRAEASAYGFDEGYVAGYEHCREGGNPELRRYLEISLSAAFPLLTTQRLLLQPLARMIRDEQEQRCTQSVYLNEEYSREGTESFRASCLDGFAAGALDCTAEHNEREESESSGAFNRDNYCGVLVCR